MRPSATNQLLTVAGAAQLLGVHANTVRTWSDQGVLDCVRINARGDRRFRRPDVERHLASTSDAGAGSAADLLIAQTGQICAGSVDLADAVTDVGRLLCTKGPYDAATWVGSAGEWRTIHGNMRPDRRLARQVRARQRVIVRPAGQAAGRASAAMPVGHGDAAGVLLLVKPADRAVADEYGVLSTIAAQLAMGEQLSGRVAEAATGMRRADVLMTMARDLGGQLDPNEVLAELVERAAALFGAQHAAVFSREPDGSLRTSATRNLSAEYCESVAHATQPPVLRTALDERRVVSVTDLADDPRAFELRRALLREGINTVTVAPLIADGDVHAVLALYHDQRYEWTASDLALFERLATQGSAIVRNAQNYSRMATWAAQLHSIQQLGTRLTRLRAVDEIGQTICAELNQLIECHNIRVYRVVGEDCVPVAWRGEVGEYESEDGEQLRPRWARASPAGWPATAWPRTLPTRRATDARRRFQGPRTTSMNRCSWRRCCSKMRSSA